MPTITLAIPSYNRPAETASLLDSILAAHALPDEVLICEDCSPERDAIREMAAGFADRFRAAGVKFVYLENERNLGYDKNLKNLLRRATGEWVLMMGNDDRLLKPGVGPIREFLRSRREIRFLSCAYEQFDGTSGKTLHVQRYFPGDTVEKSRPAYVFKLASFISGVCAQREWALGLETDRFDGGLFYQVYLSASAFAGAGIGYVATPLVGGRRGGKPLFGAAASEKGLHTPGRIAAKSRTAMYASVLAIADYIDGKVEGETIPVGGAGRGPGIADGIRRELDSKQIFHVYEDFAGRPRGEVRELYAHLRSLGLGKSPLHRLLFATAYFGGPAAPLLYRMARKLRDTV
jgi:abequosyltransferase